MRKTRFERNALRAAGLALVEAVQAFKRDDTPAAYNAINEPLAALAALVKP